MKSQASSPAGLARRKGIAALAAAAVSVAMLGVSFAAVPLYRLFCAATGFGGTPQVAKAAAAAKGVRTLKVRFDANVAPGLPWLFSPESPEIKLRTGDTATIYYKVTNLSSRATMARASFNVSPDAAGAYFDKISCFCFSEQKLGPGQSLEMPVVFFLDPALEKDATMARVDTITLSYTFFAVNAPARKALATEASRPKRDVWSP